MSDQHAYEVTVRRDGRWWFVYVPELDVGGQARALREVDEVAREVIGLQLDIDPDPIELDVSIEIPEPARTTWEAARANSAEAREHEREASRLAREAVAVLRSQGFTVRDAAAMLGISHQRVAQLDHARREVVAS